MSFAKVTIVGNLGRDPETKYSQNGTLIISFTIAAQGRFRSGQEPTTTWFRVSAFGQQAERLATMVERGYIAKGKLLYVEGQLEENTFTGNDGQERKSLEVTLSDWQFVGGRDNQQEGQRGQGNQAGGFGGNQGGGYARNQGGGRNDQSQDSGGYGGSDYGNEFPSGDEPSDLNDVPF
jgi:single-strand DNA-binding protein